MRASTLESDPGVAADPVITDRLDPSAFGAVYEQHRVSVYRYLRGRTRSTDEALDLTAITFERRVRDRYPDPPQRLATSCALEPALVALAS